MCVGRTDAGSEGARHAFKAVPRLQNLLLAGFVSHSFRHIVSDTNYKERGIFYG